MGHIRSLVLTFVAAICVSASLLACAAPASDGPDAEYSATVEVLIPTSAPASQSDSAVSPTNTPAPTYTPRPLPTYTPRPVPLPAGDQERAEAVPFQALTLDGSTLSLPDTYGTPTLLAFWAPW